MTYVTNASGQSRLAFALQKVREKGFLNAACRAGRYAVYRSSSKVSDYYRANFSVPRLAKRAISDVVASGKRGLFLDCGSNVGQGFAFFREHFRKEHFDYELFEPNPNCLPSLNRVRDQLPDHNIIIHNAALSTRDGFLTFYGLGDDEGGKLSQGGSVVKDHNSSFYKPREDASLRVKAMDFPQFIKERSQKYAVIVMKMDIEGGEYDVLEGLISTEMIDRTHTIFCEFHSQYMEPEGRKVFRQREHRILRSIQQTACSLYLWR